MTPNGPLLFLPLLTAVLSVPLIMRRIPPNRLYGVRFPKSFRDDATWYEINAYGGMLMLLGSMSQLVLAALLLLFMDLDSEWFTILMVGTISLDAVGLALLCWLRLRRL